MNEISTHPVPNLGQGREEGRSGWKEGEVNNKFRYDRFYIAPIPEDLWSQGSGWVWWEAVDVQTAGRERYRMGGGRGTGWKKGDIREVGSERPEFWGNYMCVGETVNCYQ